MRIDNIGDYHRRTVRAGQPLPEIAEDEIVMRHDGSTYIYERPSFASDEEIANALGVAFDADVQHNEDGFWID